MVQTIGTEATFTSSSTLHSDPRNQRSTRTASPMPNNDQENTEQWKTRHTAATFPKLHGTVYQYIDLLVKQNPKSPYSQQWRRLTDSKQDSQSMFKRMNWTQIGNCLGIKDFHQYCEFVMKCPEIKTYLKLTVHKGAFELTTLKPWNSIDTASSTEYKNIECSTQGETDSVSIATLDTIMEVRNTCDESSTKISELLSEVLPAFKNYIAKQPEDRYARLCQEWLDKGLKTTSTAEEIYKICELKNLEDFYYLLRLSPALKLSMNLQFIDNTIHYTVISTLKEVEPHQSSAILTPTAVISSTSKIDDAITWTNFHRKVMPIIVSWQPEKQRSHIAYAWHNAIQVGLTENSTWDEFQEYFEIDSFTEYYYYIANCQAITKIYKIHLDTATGTIYYRHIGINTPIHSTHATPVQNNIKEQSDSSQTPHSRTQPENTSLTPLCNLHNVSLTPLPIFKGEKANTITPKHQEYLSVPLLQTYQEDFGIIHSMLYHGINQWTLEAKAKEHFFYPIWIKWKYQGLQSLSDWNTIMRIMDCNNYKEYAQLMLQCTFISHTYNLTVSEKTQHLECQHKEPLKDKNYEAKLHQAE